MFTFKHPSVGKELAREQYPLPSKTRYHYILVHGHSLFQN
jgi:hypothetical protein